MLSRFRRQASPAALVISLIALFVAIGGVAGALQGKKSVDKNDLKKNVVKSKNVAGDTLTGGDIKESTLNIPASAITKDSFGATVDPSGNVTAATLPGTTASINGAGSYTVTFPRSVQGCVPDASSTSFAATAASAFLGSNPNAVNVSVGNGTQGYNVQVLC